MINDKPIPRKTAHRFAWSFLSVTARELKGDPGNPIHRHVIPAAAAIPT